jgi:hypothetical protein
MDYDFLREEYPEIISMEQLYQICHISKRKALWLLTHGVIPCEDSGKQTRRFRVRLEDVIDFLRRRDAGELESAIPRGIFSGGGHAALQADIDSEELISLLLERWLDAPDMLTIKQAAELCGYGTTAVNRWLQLGHIRGIIYRGVNLIPKESLAEHLASGTGQGISVKSEFHREIIEELQSEQNSGMGFRPMSL